MSMGTALPAYLIPLTLLQILKLMQGGQARWPVIPVPGRWWQENQAFKLHIEFKTSLGYETMTLFDTMRPCIKNKTKKQGRKVSQKVASSLGILRKVGKTSWWWCQSVLRADLLKAGRRAERMEQVTTRTKRLQSHFFKSRNVPRHQATPVLGSPFMTFPWPPQTHSIHTI